MESGTCLRSETIYATREERCQSPSGPDGTVRGNFVRRKRVGTMTCVRVRAIARSGCGLSEMTAWHTLTREAALDALKTSREGLATVEAKARVERYGPNQLQERPLRNPWLVFLGQFTEVMVIVLLVAAVLSFLVGEPTDAGMILLIVILNAILGFSQEYRAERAMAALRQLDVPTVRVRRDGQVREISSTDLVPGDIIELAAGDRVPADARVLESVNLRVDEAALTGESVPVSKTSSALDDEEAPLGDRTNMLYMGTVVTYGRGSAVVAETGMRTELGNIADMLQEVTEEKTLLQRRMAELGKWLALAALVVCALVFVVGILREHDVAEMFLVAVSLAVAAVPEGLPAVVTISLALGAQRMVRRNALIRKLPAVETLGSVTTICSDKTGTLTENRMTVTVLDIAGQSMDLITEMRHAGAVLAPGAEPIPCDDPDFCLLVAGGALCNDATLEPNDGPDEGYHTVGDPTEGALVVAAAQLGLWKADLDKALPRVAEAPFTSERKRMTTVHEIQSQSDGRLGRMLQYVRSFLPDAPYIVFTKGAVDGLLEICDRVNDDGTLRPLDDTWRQRIMRANDEMAFNGVRVLGVATKTMSALPETIDEDSLERGLVFVGMTGMIDPPRPEVREAVAQCRTAGIRPVMITGDHPLTALNIARQLQIARDGDAEDEVITGPALAAMSVEELESIVENISVFARVSPEHKVKIVEALKARGHVCAMTGDGVNDAPALKRADIGVAMGITGTDVSKEAADMVLLDDNFATIVHAIEEGRTIYENIRKFVRYIISSNVGEILIMFMAPLLGMPVPLTAVQLLWINLVTDGPPALALGIERADPNIMKRPPHKPDESVLARGLGSYILGVGSLLGVVCLATLFFTRNLSHEVWQTMVFTTLGLSQMGNVLAVRSDRESLFKLGLLSNKWLLGSVILTILLQMAVIYVPFLQKVFDTTALTAGQLGISLALSTVVFMAAEISKAIHRHREAVASAS